VKLEPSCVARGLRTEAPDDFAEFLIVLEYAEGAVGEGLQVKRRSRSNASFDT
jgi:hypothetical protein